jgi:hypothetical protein
MDFVIGHPRSGTQLLSAFLNAGGAAVSAHELLTTLAPEAVAACTEYYEGRRGAESIERILQCYERRPESAIRIDCNWKLAWILPPLVEHYPDARVLHLTREPRENVRSSYNLDYYGRLWSHPQYQTDEQRNLWLRWMPELRRDDWSSLSQFERNCAFWSETHRLLLAACESRRNYLRVRLEDLSDDSVMEDVFTFFHLAPPPREALDSVRRTRFNTKDDEKREVSALRPESLPPPAEWPEPVRATVRRLCGEMATRLGYSL